LIEFPVKLAAPLQQKTACAILPLFEKGALPDVTIRFDKASKGRIGRLLRAKEVSGSLGATQLLRNVTGSAAERVLTVGCGPRERFTRKEFHKALSAAAAELKRSAIRDAISYLFYVLPADVDVHYGARLTVEAIRGTLYSFDELKSKPEPGAKLRRLGIAVRERSEASEARGGATAGTAVANGVELARNLGNRPANICTPAHLAAAARDVAKQSRKLKVKVLAESDMKKLGMGSLLSVTQGSANPAKLIVMEYRGTDSTVAPVALCGKGITFDTGGISLKPPPKMDEMKFDMCGAASVIGTMAAIAELESPINIVAVVPTCENMPSGTATRPGDVVRSMSGKTIEVLNTDAEGRLILCDAITYAQSFNPSCVIDVATLTGACVIALGGVYAGVFANNEDLSKRLIAAGGRSLDLVWPMPADPEYGDSLRSNFADFANVGGREGGASIAARFLANFIENELPWAHVDIAGVAWRADREKGATGRPVPMLVDFLVND
jgi:leucyl aminopeptidase